MSQVAKALSSREIALARRKALSSGGKAAIQGGDRTAAQANTARSSATAPASAAPRPAPRRQAAPAAGSSAREASLARRKALSTRGKAADTSSDRTRVDAHKRGAAPQPAAAKAEPAAAKNEGCGCGCKGKRQAEDTVDTAARSARKPVRRRAATVASNTGKALALARRKALSTRGKAALSNAMSEAQAVRASNPKVSGRELAKVVREQRSRRGGAGQKKSQPCGRVRKAADTSPAGAQDAPWKVGASETATGQVVTGTMVGRKHNMTGDEPSTCRVITGTEYLGADIFRQFCQTDSAPASTARKVTVTSTSHGNAVTGNRLGRASNVTGNEPGTCKKVTGDEYVSAEQVQGYCGELASKSPRKVSMAETMKGKVVTGNNVGRSEAVTGDEYGMRKQLTGTQYTKPADIGQAPEKVGVSQTLRGGSVTGTLVGRRQKMTGDEPGSCRDITGDDYIGREQYETFCDAAPQPSDAKVGVSQTLSGLGVTGSMVGRAQRVTGDEPGTCKAVTGTPYVGSEQVQGYCEPNQQAEAVARMQPGKASWGKPMTGIQPGITDLTGADKGACETVSGTPYVGADQAAAACPATAADPASLDFPQTLEQAPWGDFSVNAPLHASQQQTASSQVTGSQYERGHITGPFGMAAGKVTGTEQARFDRQPAADIGVATAEQIDGRVKSRITGEGQDAGLKITGDDWERGEHVTGTEGHSATRRNATLRGGPMSAMGARAVQPEAAPEPVSKVTGSSGNTEKGSLVTYSGGARG